MKGNVIRFLDPQRKAHHIALRQHEEVHTEHMRHVQAGRQSPHKDALAQAEDSLAAVHEVEQKVPCFKCGDEINFAADKHSRVTITCVNDQDPADGPSMAYFTHPASLLTSKVSLLRPPETGEIALCVGCRARLEDYLIAQEVEN
jgi:hypothetical protein